MLRTLSLLLLTACTDVDAGSTAPLELRTYAVPAGTAQETVAVLSRVLPGQGEGATAKVTLGPDGRVVVVAPERLQDGVATLIAELAAAGPLATPQVRMDYWLVLGEPASETEVAPALQQVAAALQQVAAAQVPMRFTLVEGLAVRAASGEEAFTQGRMVETWQNASVRGDQVVSDIMIDPDGPGRVQTRVQLAVGQVLVLGETGVDPTLWEPTKGDHPEGTMLYYLVRPSVEAPSGAR